MRQTTTTHQLSDLYSDTQRCAELVGLTYSPDNQPGIARVRHGRGFSFKDEYGNTIRSKKTKQRITELTIPPAWQDVWICPNSNGHLLATGIDERGRKQYIYHPKWRIVRDLIKFYRLSILGRTLPRIRRKIRQHLREDNLNKERIMAAMVWLLDNTYLRIGNDVYAKENDSFGLTTLARQHAVVAGSVVTFSFKGKSGKDQQITIDNPQIADIVSVLKGLDGNHLFRYDTGAETHRITAADINVFLRDLAGEPVSAKDFRTWGGTLLAFDYLIENEENKKKANKITVEAVDAAAGILGNTRAVARSSYVHPHILDQYGSKNFSRYYKMVTKQDSVRGLSKRENELLHFLEAMFKHEFDLLS